MQENHNLVYSFYRTNGCVIKARARSTRQTLISKNLNSSVLPLEVKIPSDEGVNIWILFDLKRGREKKKKKKHGKDSKAVQKDHNKAISEFPRASVSRQTKCEAIDMNMIFYSHANKTHFHYKWFSLSLIIKMRFLKFGNRVPEKVANGSMNKIG